MLVRRLTPDDHDLLDAAVREFRDVSVADHEPFLRDPASIAFVALERDELVGWVWGLRQRHVAATGGSWTSANRPCFRGWPG
jgi:hypothetical protein